MTEVRYKRETISNKQLEALESAKFRNNLFEVGVVDSSITYPDGERVVDVAVYNEFGTSNAPERPAMRIAIIEATPELRKIGQRQAALILGGRLTIAAAATNLAKILKKHMQFTIRTLDSPPNAPSTIKQKGFDDPLIDTELFVNSIDYKLGRGASE